MRRRTKTTLLIVALLLALLAALIYLHIQAPPEAARLLPESDGILYIDLKPLRTATHFDQHPVHHDEAYQHFIDSTGFVFERDLNEAAFALHRMPNPLGPNGPVAFSEVFVGRFDRKRLEAYLGQASASREQYAGHTIFSLPSDGRTVRVTLLGYDMVAVSNAPTPEQIHAIRDRYRSAALPFSGSSVLTQYYSQVPALSLAWGIGKITLPLESKGGPRVFGMPIHFDLDTAFIASLRYLGSLRLRVEEIAANPTEAAATATTLRALIGLVAASQDHLPGPLANSDYRELLNSARVEQKGDRAIFSANIPVSLVERVIAPATGSGPAALSPEGMSGTPSRRTSDTTSGPMTGTPTNSRPHPASHPESHR